MGNKVYPSPGETPEELSLLGPGRQTQVDRPSNRLQDVESSKQRAGMHDLVQILIRPAFFATFPASSLPLPCRFPAFPAHYPGAVMQHRLARQNLVAAVLHPVCFPPDVDLPSGSGPSTVRDRPLYLRRICTPRNPHLEQPVFLFKTNAKCSNLRLTNAAALAEIAGRGASECR